MPNPPPKKKHTVPFSRMQKAWWKPNPIYWHILTFPLHSVIVGEEEKAVLLPMSSKSLISLIYFSNKSS